MEMIRCKRCGSWSDAERPPTLAEKLRVGLYLIIVTLILGIVAGHSEPDPYVKSRGQCTGSYVQSGSFCVPKSGGTVKPSFPKPPGATCPGGYPQSGGGCQKS